MKVRAATWAKWLAGAMALGGALFVSGCVNDVGADEDEPFDDRQNVDEQGLHDCSEHSATGYTSGHPFAIKTVTVDGKPLQVDTANAYLAMQAKAASQGISIRVVSGFRTMAEQEFLYGCYIHGNCNGGNLAAVPGFSNHQSGHAIDMNTSDSGVYSWLTSHAHELGFARTVPSEIWHWEWWGHASDFPGPCGGPPVPPKCASGHFHGAYCDDDGHSDEQSHD
ncbi:MAG TPA: M15 family metallopeptidase, partial [Myxococcota bacterium]